VKSSAIWRPGSFLAAENRELDAADAMSVGESEGTRRIKFDKRMPGSVPTSAFAGIAITVEK
jgi:hypothetical protein